MPVITPRIAMRSRLVYAFVPFVHNENVLGVFPIRKPVFEFRKSRVAIIGVFASRYTKVSFLDSSVLYLVQAPVNPRILIATPVNWNM